MRVYTYSEARQKLASLLDIAQTEGAVAIRRRNGQTFIPALRALEWVTDRRRGRRSGRDHRRDSLAHPGEQGTRLLRLPVIL